MIRVKIVKDTKHYQQGQTLTLSNNEAFGLIDSGYATLSKDMVATDYKMKSVKRKK